MTICIDVTELSKVNFTSGIQRVVKEITIRWISWGYDIKLLVYNPKRRYFEVIDKKDYYNFYIGKGKTKRFRTADFLRIEDFSSDDIFFDIDSVWMNPLKRSYLLPEVKKKGAKVAAHIYDIIPVTEAQYCHEFTILSFLEYIGAQIKYADLIIANAKATLDAINRLIDGTEVKNINGKVVKLGCDIKKDDLQEEVSPEIRQISEKGKYVLMVGTIEPRKNHKYVLEAFEKCLFAENINLVFAGRMGWNMESFIKYIENHKEYGRRLFWIKNATDGDIVHLYENSLLVAFPSYNEGFGLPIIEAFARETVVVAADIPVLHEVGEDYCDYFSLNRPQEFIDLVQKYKNDEKKWKEAKLRLKEYKRNTWDECAQQMYENLMLLA